MQEIEIVRLGHHGDGIGQAADGADVYAPRTLPGERVAGRLEGRRLEDVRILRPSDLRVRADCAHYRQCGGCDLLHVADAFVATWKEDLIRTALADHGLSAPFRPISVSPPASRRRATFAARRTKSGALAGFHGRRSDTIVPVPGCKVLHPDLLALLPVAEALAIAGGSRKAVLSVSVTLSEAGADVAVSGGKPLDAATWQRLAGIAADHALARLSWDGETVLARADPVQRFDGIAVVPPSGAFLQATVAGETALQQAVAEILSGARVVADLFAGCGTFALPLARLARVHAVEGEATMLAALDAGWRQGTRLREVTTRTRDLFRAPLMAEDLVGFDGVVIDPPRAGAVAQIAELAHSSVPLIAYVSCNPVSFARDAAALVAGGFRLEWVLAVDQFRWSPHVELVAAFHRNS